MESRVKMEVEAAGMLPLAKECRGLQKLEEAGRVLPWGLRGNTALPTPWFQTSGLQNGVVLKDSPRKRIHPFYRRIYLSSRGNSQPYRQWPGSTWNLRLLEPKACCHRLWGNGPSLLDRVRLGNRGRGPVSPLLTDTCEGAEGHRGP